MLNSIESSYTLSHINDDEQNDLFVKKMYYCTKKYCEIVVLASIIVIYYMWISGLRV